MTFAFLQRRMSVLRLSLWLISIPVVLWAGIARKVFFVLCIGLSLCSLPVFSDALAWPLRRFTPTCLPASCSPSGAIVVLGGGGGTGAGSRIEMGARLHKGRLANWLILSGGGPGATPEAVVMRRAAIGYGVPERSIDIEVASRNTRENAKFTAAILRSKGVDKILLVTSDLHMTRARYAFSRHGIQVEPAGIDSSLAMEIRGWRCWVPSFSSLFGGMRVIKEYIGLTVYFTMDWWSSKYM